jgi:hypothetical protein
LSNTEILQMTNVSGDFLLYNEFRLGHWLQVKDFSKLSSRLGLSRIVWYDLRYERES